MAIGRPILIMLCAVLTTAAIASPKVTAVAVVGTVLLVLMVRFPAFGMSVLGAFFIAQQSPLYQQYGVLLSRGATLTDVGAICVVAGVLLESRRDGTDPLALIRGRGLAPVLATVAYFAWRVASGMWSNAPASTILSGIRLEFEAPILLLVALVSLRSRSRARWAMGAYALTGLALAAYVSANFSSLHGLSSGPPTLSQLQAYRGGQTGYNQNELSVILSLVPSMAYLALETVSVRLRLLLTAATVPPVGFALVVLTSRGTLISLGVGVVAAILFSRGGRTKLVVALLAGAVALMYGAAATAGIIPRYFQQRFGRLATDQAGGRGPVWNLALNLFERHPLGLGAQGFETLLPSANVTLYQGVASAHSVYVGTLADFGVVGGFLLLTLMASLAREIVFRGGDRNPAVIIIFAVLAVAIINGDYFNTHWYWTVVALALAYALTAQSKLGGAHPNPGRPDAAMTSTSEISLT